MATKSPIQTVKEKFGDKAKLVEAVEAFTKDDLWVARTNESKGLKHVSNSKLMRLHRIFSDVKERFGTRAKLIDAILEVTKRVKDEGYKAALGKFPVPRLYDLYRSTAKRNGVAKAPGAAASAPPAAEAKPAKKAPAKKAAAKAVEGAAPAPATKGATKGAPAAAKKTAAKKTAAKKD
jgi:hypothetical protein